MTGGVGRLVQRGHGFGRVGLGEVFFAGGVCAGNVEFLEKPADIESSALNESTNFVGKLAISAIWPSAKRWTLNSELSSVMRRPPLPENCRAYPDEDCFTLTRNRDGGGYNGSRSWGQNGNTGLNRSTLPHSARWGWEFMRSEPVGHEVPH